MSIESRIDECRAEVDSAIGDLHKRIESVEHMQQLIHDIYTATKHTDERLANLMISFASYTAKQDLIAGGFPGDDPEGHRKAHELFIEQARNRAIFWGKMRDEAGKWGIISVLGFLFMSVWLAIKAEVHK